MTADVTYVANLTKAIAAELDLTERLSTITLHRVVNEATNELSGPLDSTLTVEEADLPERARLVVKAPPAAAAASRSGVYARASREGGQLLPLSRDCIRNTRRCATYPPARCAAACEASAHRRAAGEWMPSVVAA